MLRRFVQNRKASLCPESYIKCSFGYFPHPYSVEMGWWSGIAGKGQHRRCGGACTTGGAPGPAQAARKTILPNGLASFRIWPGR